MSKKKIDRAGTIPYVVNDNEIKMMFMFPSDPKFGGDTWQISKGKHEDGETPKQTAIREASEELGLFKGNIDGDIHHLGKFLGRTDIFICKIKEVDMFGDPCYETKDVRWMTPEQFQKEGRDLHKPVVKAAVRFIKKKEELK